MPENSLTVYNVGHEMIPYLNFAQILQYHVKTQICNIHKDLCMEIILSREYVLFCHTTSNIRTHILVTTL
jgi:hypothetical protein